MASNGSTNAALVMKISPAPAGLTARVLDYDPDSFEELTPGQAVEDPLIASLNLADNVSNFSFSEILSAAARVLVRK